MERVRVVLAEAQRGLAATAAPPILSRPDASAPEALRA
jgi:hypothetical protein